jgi:prolyl 4-hydroxylase
MSRSNKNEKPEKKKSSDNNKKDNSKINSNKLVKNNDNKNLSKKKLIKNIDKNPDNYRAKIDKLVKINTSRFPEGFNTKLLNENPYIVKIRRFLNTEEVDTLINMAEGKFTRSTIVVNGQTTHSNVRTSETAFITENGNRNKYSYPVERVLNKVCYLTGCNRTQIESLMVVKYGNGEEYYNHHDYFKSEHQNIIADGGQRIATFFCYLSSLNEDEGGETEFPLIELKCKPSKGTAIFWWNVDTNGNLLYKTLHRGNPVKSKNRIKYGLNIWIREKGWN